MTPADTPKAPQAAAAETRQHIRVEARLDVTFSIAGDSSAGEIRAVTRDISHGGACLAITDCPETLLGVLARLPLLNLEIDLSHAGAGMPAPATQPAPAVPAILRGQVEWVHPAAKSRATTLIGLEFRDVNRADETAIIDLIAHILLDNREPHAATPPPGR